MEGYEPGVTVLKISFDGEDDKGKISVCGPDIDIDTDNNNIIDEDDNDEDQYEEYPPGKIIPINLEGDGSGQDTVAPLFLSVFSEPDSGNIELKAIKGSDNVKLYKNSNKSGSITLPKTWSSATDVPKTLYVDGIKKGQAILELSYTASNNEVLNDKIALFITETISWAPDTDDDNAYIWSSLPNLVTTDGYEFEDQLELQGFDVIWLEDVDNHNNLNFNDCTLDNYKYKMIKSGALTVISHGGPGCHYAVYAENSQAGYNACVAWIGNEPNMTVEYWDDPHFFWTVRVSSKWLANNWASSLNENKAIALWSICHSAIGDTTTGEVAVKESAGGRWRSGYIEPTWATEAMEINKKFLQRMNGKTDNSEKRTAGEAWDNNKNYYLHYVFPPDSMQGKVNAKMDGNDWTTLCPAPMKESPVWPQSNPGNRKGAGCIIFDTYMNDCVEDDPVYRLSGRNITDSGWIENTKASFGWRFKFGSTGGTTKMKADGIMCNSYHEGIINLGRELDGDRKTPNKDHKEWSF